MKGYSASRSTSASAQTVWRLWSDPNNWSTWNSGIKEAKLFGALADGTKGQMTTTSSGAHEVTFHHVEPPRGFSLSMNGPMTTITFSCEITPTATGCTIAQSASFTGPLAFIMGPMIGPTMAKHFVPVLDDLAAAAEKEPAPSA